MKELWKRIEGVDNYEISNLGRVKSLAKEHKICNVNKLKYNNIKELCSIMFPEKILKPSVDNSGYYHVRLRIQTNIYKLYKVHRLVAKYFLENFSEDQAVLHKDGNKLNNEISNLSQTKLISEDGSVIMNYAISHRYKCEQTGEIFCSFKSFCKRNGIAFNKYYFLKAVREKTNYMTTEYSFTKIK